MEGVTIKGRRRKLTQDTELTLPVLQLPENLQLFQESFFFKMPNMLVLWQVVSEQLGHTVAQALQALIICWVALGWPQEIYIAIVSAVS